MQFRWKIPRKHQCRCHHVIHNNSGISDTDFSWCYGILQCTGISESHKQILAEYDLRDHLREGVIRIKSSALIQVSTPSF